MNVVSRIVNRLRTDYFRSRYKKAARRVLTTPAISRGNIPYILLSMVQHSDVLSYLIAVKSFSRFLNPERIVIICDPSITPEDRAVFLKHIPHAELKSAGEFTHSKVPRGGCWERLLAISELSPEMYVVQLDADTVTSSDVPEVRSAVQGASGFVLGEANGQQLLSLRETSLIADTRLSPGAHIQTLSESTIAKIGLPENKLYVRGCAGFTGFPSDAEMRDTVIEFSARMYSTLGEQWWRWGTEQVTSNFAVANSRRTRILPFPKYCTPDLSTPETVFRHFIGSMRFINGKYERSSKLVIDQLNTEHHFL